MIGPVLRLVLTYVVLIAAVVAVFNRDKIGALFSGGEAPPAEHAVYTPVAPPGAQAPAPASSTPQFGAPQQTAPVYGSDLQTPFAETAPAPAAPAAPATAATAADPDAVAAAVNAAREAYWTGDAEGARARMQALAAAHPGNIDVLGELGNLDYALRDYPAAAEVYYQAGTLMIAAGQQQRAMSLLPALQSIDPDKAADLAARMQGR